MYIGIDIGGTNTKAVLTNREGDIINFKNISTGKKLEEIENHLHELIFEISTGSASIDDVKAIGIGAAGSIDRSKGMIITSPNISAWKKYPLAKRIESRIGKKVVLENDATAAIIGEWWKGEGSQYKNWIMLTLGTGIGGGAILDNRLYTGQTGSSMEFGHVSIDYNGKKCLCGNNGCLEQYASATAVVKLANSELKKNSKTTIIERIKNEILTSKILYEEAVNGDEFSIMILNKIAGYLGIGISNLVNIFNPEAVIIGGGLSRAHKFLLPKIKEVVMERSLDGLKENIKYLAVADEQMSPVLGAAKLAIDIYDQS